MTANEDDPKVELIVRPKVVRVEWVDSSSKVGWYSKDEIDGYLSIVSCGFLVKETDTEVVLTTSYDHANGQYVDPLTIPTVCIKTKDVVA